MPYHSGVIVLVILNQLSATCSATAKQLARLGLLKLNPTHYFICNENFPTTFNMIFASVTCIAHHMYICDSAHSYIMTYTPFTPKLKHVLRLFCQTRFKLFFLIEAVDFKCSTLKIQVSNYLNLKENLVFQFPVSDFSSFKPTLIINALLVNGVRDGV